MAEKVLPKEQRQLRALAEKRVRLHLQRNMSDINQHSYRIFLNAGEEEFKELMRKRHQRMLEICSTVDGRPVTPPQLPFHRRDRHRPELYQTYHIVELVHPGDHNYIQLMFRETDMYFVAFRHLTRDAERRDSSGWFRFKQEDEFIVPSFIQSEEIYYDYGYGDLTKCSVGPRCFTDIYHCLRRFTPANAKGTSDQRTRVLMTCCLMFSETQRFVQMQEEVLENIRNGQDKRINHLIELIHDWIVESRRRASTADQAVVPASAQQASSSTTSSCSAVVPAAAAQEASSSTSTPSGSVDYGLWLLKYENSCFLPLIKRQQQQQQMKREGTSSSQPLVV